MIAVALATVCLGVVLTTVVLLYLSARKGKRLVLEDKLPEPLPRPKWDDYFLGIAVSVAARGECTRARVGAVVVQDRRILSTGYNGAEAGKPSCLTGNCPRGHKTYTEVPALTSYTEGEGACIAIHAEDNALRYAGKFCAPEDIAGCTVYITREPCADCNEKLKQAGVKHVVWPDGDRYYEDDNEETEIGESENAEQ